MQIGKCLVLYSRVMQTEYFYWPIFVWYNPVNKKMQLQQYACLKLTLSSLRKQIKQTNQTTLLLN